MNINRNNCESFFLDYYEKTLSPVEVAEVLFFLEENPDMKEVFESYEAIYLEQDKTNFPGKDSLKKIHNREGLEAVLSSEINKSNCEQFFIAASEGVLSSEQIQRLNSFLAQHPELRKDFELFQKCKLTDNTVVFENKDLLKRETITDRNREEYFVRSIDKDLTPAEQKQLAAFLQDNPEYTKELELFSKTVLPAETIVFENKASLKKKERKPVVFVTLNISPRTIYYAAAASILLLMGLFFFLNSNDNRERYVAEKANHKDNKTVNTEPAPEDEMSTETNAAGVPQQKEALSSGNNQIVIKKNTSMNKNHKVIEPVVKEEAPQPLMPENKVEEIPIAKKEEGKKLEPVEEPAVAKNNEPKKDSVAATPVQGEAIASTVKTKAGKEEYQTISAVVNKKIRSVLGIKKSTECETSDKIGLWDLAMAAKRGVQKRIGAKTLDVNKVCDGENGKVEYVFAAGNFQISKSVSR